MKLDESARTAKKTKKSLGDLEDSSRTDFLPAAASSNGCESVVRMPAFDPTRRMRVCCEMSKYFCAAAEHLPRSSHSAEPVAMATRRAQTPDVSVQESTERFTMIPELPDVHRCCWKAEALRDRC